jgi:hypothetical protein
MSNLDDIEYKENVYYDANKKRFVDMCIDETIVIDEPIIMMETFHSCYSHALVDCCFAIFWCIQDLIQSKKIENNNVHIFIKDKKLLKYQNNIEKVDALQMKFKGVYNDIVNILTPYPILFQHLIKGNYLFRPAGISNRH